MASLIEKDTSGIYIAQEGEIELPQERTRSFKKFKITGTRQRRIAGQIGPIHYRDDPFSDVEDYKEIDLTINLTPGESWDAAMESNGYQVRFWQSREIGGKTVRYIAQFRRAGKWLAMAPLALAWENDAGQRQLISKPVAGIVPVIDNDSYTVMWNDCFGSGIHYRYNSRPDHFFKTVIVDSKSDLPAPTISAPGLKLTVVLGISWHSQSKAGNGFAAGVVPDEVPNDTDNTAVDEEVIDSGKFAYQDESLRDTFWMRRPKAWDSAEERHGIGMTWRLQRRGNRVFAAMSVPASALNHTDTVYPVYVDVAIGEEQVGASSDDCRENNGFGPDPFNTTSPQVITGNFDAVHYRSGMRFTTVPIPQGVTIDSASISIYADASMGVGEGDLVGEIFDDAPTYSDAADWLARRISTFGPITWDTPDGDWDTDTWEVSPDIASIIQSITDQVGWSNNNALGIQWHSVSTGRKFRTGDSYDNVSGNAPKFNASYTDSGRSRIMGGGNFTAKSKSPSGVTVNVSRYTANQTLIAANHHVEGATDGAAFIITLPAGRLGTEYRITNTGTSGNVLTITPDGAELLLGENSSFILFDDEALLLVYSDAGGWF